MGQSPERITHCRLCGSEEFNDVLDLGNMPYTGRFPNSDEQDPPSVPLAAVQCKKCHLIQLAHTYPLDEMFGDTYGYRSSITETMRNHLNDIKNLAMSWKRERKSDLNILDIGSNDGTLLGFFSGDDNTLTGIDPCSHKHVDNYPEGARVISNFFSEQNVRQKVGDEKFDIITSIAMFYDIDDPASFARDIHSLLENDGVWITEQTHSHTLIESTCYDSICQEHVTYLSLGAMEKICETANLKIVDIITNNMNGGSFAAVIARNDSKLTPNEEAIKAFRDRENELRLNQDDVWIDFKKNVEKHREDLKSFLNDAKNSGKKIFGYGASTKGNVVLHYCGLTKEDIPAILERDPLKYGKVTPGTRIPIISEDEGRSQNPDVLVVLPWHFRDEIVKREAKFLENGGTLLFPLPEMEAVTR